MRASSRGRVRASKKDIRKILNLPSSTWENFWGTCEKHGYITGNDTDGYELIDIFRYGKLDRRRSTKMQKIYTGTFMRLYRTGRLIGPTKSRDLKVSDHKLIGMLLFLAAYWMCPITNEIVANPQAAIPEQLQPLSMTGIAQKLGYDTASGHAARDAGRLLGLTYRLTDDGRDMYCMIKLETAKGPRYIINPTLIYAGDRTRYEEIMQLPQWYVDCSVQ